MIMMRKVLEKVERQIGEVEATHDALVVAVVGVDGDDHDNNNKKELLLNKRKKKIEKAWQMVCEAGAVYKEAEGVMKECEKLEGLLWRLDDAVMELEHSIEDAENVLEGGGNGDGLLWVGAMASAGCLVWAGFLLLA